MSNKCATVKEHTVRVCSQIFSRIKFSPKVSALAHMTPHNLDSKRQIKRPARVILFFPKFMLTICLLRKFIQKFRLEGTSGMCQVQCPAQSWDNCHVRADCSGPCPDNFWNLQRGRCYNLPGQCLSTEQLWGWSPQVQGEFPLMQLVTIASCPFPVHLWKGFVSRSFLQVEDGSSCFTLFLMCHVLQPSSHLSGLQWTFSRLWIYFLTWGPRMTHMYSRHGFTSPE